MLKSPYQSYSSTASLRNTSLGCPEGHDLVPRGHGYGFVTGVRVQVGLDAHFFFRHPKKGIDRP